MKQLTSQLNEPKSFVITVNAGAISREHWTQSSSVGGGRLIGEACHFVDLLRFCAGSRIIDWHLHTLNADTKDTFNISLRFKDGSIGNINYFSNGHKSLPKERIECFASGRVLQLDNFKSLVGYGWPNFKKIKSWRQNKGQNECVEAFVRSVQTGSQHLFPHRRFLKLPTFMAMAEVNR